MSLRRILAGTGLLIVAMALAACGTTAKYSPRPGGETRASGRSQAETLAPAQGRRMVGKPYVINGRQYVPREDPKYDEVGLASWYGEAHHGRMTANGEIFDMTLPTAAHKTLPLPSLVEVTNLETGRKVVLRLNDRGPFVDGRIIDLSKAAAEELGVLRQGVARVRVRYLGPAPLGSEQAAAPPRNQTSRSPVRSGGAYEVQVGAFAERSNAERAAALVSGEIRPLQRDGGVLWRVVVGPVGSQAEAMRARERAAARGFPDAAVIGPF